MGRLHLFELEDQPWFPNLIREYMTDYLNFTASLTVLPFTGFARKLREAMERTGDRVILDLCSGGGGPLPQIVGLLRGSGFPVRGKLTDYYPNLTAFRRIQEKNPDIEFVPTPVDATAVPRDLEGFRLLMNSFHHFRPEMARKILEDAARSRRGIAVLELVGRSPLAFFQVSTLLIGMPLLTPFMRPFRVSRLIFTYLVPLVPLFSLWDGFVSCLRVYSPKELKALTDGIQVPGYHWEMGKIPLEKGPGSVTYLVGRP